MKSLQIKIFVDVEDVQKFHGKSACWAYDRLRMIRKHAALQPHQRVTLFQFCDFENIPYKKFLKQLNQEAESHPH